MKVSAAVEVTTIRPGPDYPMGLRIDHRTGERRPMTPEEIKKLADRDARVAAHLNRKEN